MAALYCLASLDVPDKDTAEFVSLQRQVMPLFTSNDWELLLGLEQDRTADNTGGQRSVHPNVYLNLWKIPSLSSLQAVMNQAADNFSYVALDELVAEEIQSLAAGLYYDPYKQRSVAEMRSYPRYMVELLDLVRDPGARNELAVQMNTCTVEMRSKYGWNLLCAVNCLTGTINRYVHLWGIDATRDSAWGVDATQMLQALVYYRQSDTIWSEQYRKTVKTWHQAWWTPAPYCEDAEDTKDAQGTEGS